MENLISRCAYNLTVIRSAEPRFRKYSVDVYPFSVAGFEPLENNRLSRTEVTITAAFPDGPRPRAYLPPGYAPEHPRPSDDDEIGILYNTTGDAVDRGYFSRR